MTGVVSFVGAGTINATPNTGRLTIALKPRRSARSGGRGDRRGCRRRSPASRASPRSSSRCRTSRSARGVSRTQFQYTLMDTDAAELGALGAAAAGQAARACRNCAMSRRDQQDEGFRTFITVDRDAAMRLGVSMQAIEDTLYDGSASGRSRRSSARPTSIAWCWRPIRPGRPTPTALRLLRVPGSERRRRCRCPRSPDRDGSPPRW